MGECVESCVGLIMYYHAVPSNQDDIFSCVPLALEGTHITHIKPGKLPLLVPNSFVRERCNSWPSFCAPPPRLGCPGPCERRWRALGRRTPAISPRLECNVHTHTHDGDSWITYQSVNFRNRECVVLESSALDYYPTG